MLGAIPGRDPKLTMMVLLSYADSSNTVYPDALEVAGKKFSIMNPDLDMIQKMLYVADQPPLVPSPDFWTSDGTSLTAGINPLLPEKTGVSNPADSKKRMPDITGKSLRAGLQVLQHYNMEVKLVGSGRIISQHPAAGLELKDVAACTLKMRQEI